MYIIFFVLFRELDSGLAESVSTLIWAAPRLQSEVAELKIVSTSSFCNVCRLLVLLCFVLDKVSLCHSSWLGTHRKLPLSAS